MVKITFSVHWDTIAVTQQSLRTYTSRQLMNVIRVKISRSDCLTNMGRGSRLRFI